MKKIIIAILMSTLMILGIKNVNASGWRSQWINGTQVSEDWGTTYTTLQEDNTNFYMSGNQALSANNEKSYWLKFGNGPFTINQEDENIYITMRFVNYLSDGTINISGQEGSQVCTIQHGNTSIGEYENLGFTCPGYTMNMNGTIRENLYSMHLEIMKESETSLTACLPNTQNGIEYTFICPAVGNTIKGVRLTVKSTTDALLYKYGLYFTYLTKTNNENQNYNYSDTPSEDMTSEETKMNDYSTREQALMNSLDFSEVNNLDITMNPNASSYIWNIVNRLRGINPAIIVLITSVLGLGIIKMILNR